MGFSHGHGALPPREDAIRPIRMAHEMGCPILTLRRVAERGGNEEPADEALVPLRHKVTIATKSHIYSRENLEQQIESRPDASLKRLRTDFVDLYYQHRNEAGVPLCRSPMAEFVMEERQERFRRRRERRKAAIASARRPLPGTPVTSRPPGGMCRQDARAFSGVRPVWKTGRSAGHMAGIWNRRGVLTQTSPESR